MLEKNKATLISNETSSTPKFALLGVMVISSKINKKIILM
jgi:hypothetical protein